MVDEITKALENDIRSALQIKSALEAANAIIASDPVKKYHGAETYNLVKQCLILTLAQAVARMFDTPSARFHRNASDKATVLLLTGLLRRKRVRIALIDRAREWTGFNEDFYMRDCADGIDRAIAEAVRFGRSTSLRHSLRRLRSLRDTRLAHLLIDNGRQTAKSVALPTFDDVYKLLDVAREVMDGASLAVNGRSPALEGYENAYRDSAEVFWTKALNGARLTG